MLLRIRPGQPSGGSSAASSFKTANLIGGLYMWHKDSAGKWYMADIENNGSDNPALPANSIAVPENTARSGNFFDLGTGSSIFLFSSLARGA